MELEISVEDLLSKRKIESDRIEFKTGWRYMQSLIDSGVVETESNTNNMVYRVKEEL